MSQARTDVLLAEQVSEFYGDPLGFVLFAFPWGEKGRPLEGFQGPRKWQWEYLEELGEEVRARGFDGINPVEPIQMARSSGHGIGKSALSSWLILWLMSTRPHCKGVVTANTSDQLKTKTWAELGKWRKMCATGHWFVYNASKGNMNLLHAQHPETWRCDAQTCREENSESFAGLHAVSSTPFYLFDEASAIPDKIWEVSDGGLTDGEPMRFAFGNPTRNTGRFRECFGRLRHRWNTGKIDSRTVAGTNKNLMAQWVEDYGEDSDFVRVRVRGEFPRAGSQQYFPIDLVERCMDTCYTPDVYEDSPRIIGVDVARFGHDESVIVRRQGRKFFPYKAYRNLDLMTLANIVAREAIEFEPDAIFVDGVGVGAGVVDRLRQLGFDVIDVQSGAKAEDKKLKNKRMEMFARLKQAMQEGLEIPPCNLLKEEFTGIEYDFTPTDVQFLTPKDAMEHSPDKADAHALTYAEIVMRHVHRDEPENYANADYDPLGHYR